MVGPSPYTPSALAPAPTLRPPHMEPAREGREKCRYDDDTRLVAGCLPVTHDGRLLLIGSVKRTDWILPKGGWDIDETAAEAAVREAYEEAGVREQEEHAPTPTPTLRHTQSEREIRKSSSVTSATRSSVCFCGAIRLCFSK